MLEAWQGYVRGLQYSVLTARVGAQPKSNGTCVLVGDDEAFLAEATALAQRELGCKVFQGHKKYVMSSHTQWKFNSLPLETRCTATLNLFTDLEMLAHTDYFVGALLARDFVHSTVPVYIYSSAPVVHPTAAHAINTWLKPCWHNKYCFNWAILKRICPQTCSCMCFCIYLPLCC